MKPLATTEPKRRCLLLPREVVLLGGGNSDKGGKEGGFFSLSFCGYFQKRTIPVETINPDGRVWVWKDEGGRMTNLNLLYYYYVSSEAPVHF